MLGRKTFSIRIFKGFGPIDFKLAMLLLRSPIPLLFPILPVQGWDQGEVTKHSPPLENLREHQILGAPKFDDQDINIFKNQINSKNCDEHNINLNKNRNLTCLTQIPTLLDLDFILNFAI